MKLDVLSVLVSLLVTLAVAVYDDEAFIVDSLTQQIGDFKGENALYSQGDVLNILSDKGILAGVEDGQIKWRAQFEGLDSVVPSRIVPYGETDTFIVALNYGDSSTVSLWRSNGSLIRTIFDFDKKKVSHIASLPSDGLSNIIVALQNGELLVFNSNDQIILQHQLTQHFSNLKISAFANGNAILLFKEKDTQNINYAFYDYTKQTVATYPISVGFDTIHDFQGSRIIFKKDKYYAQVISKVTGITAQPVPLPSGQFIPIPNDEVIALTNRDSVEIYTNDGKILLKIPFVSDFRLDFSSNVFILYTSSEIRIIDADSGDVIQSFPTALTISDIDAVKSYTDGIDGLKSIIINKDGSFSELINGVLHSTQPPYIGDVVSHTVIDIPSEKDITGELLHEEELNLLEAYVYRVHRHFKDLRKAYERFWDLLPGYFSGEYVPADSSNSKYFGFEKLLVLGTSKNRIVAYDTLTGSQSWSVDTDEAIVELKNDGDLINVFTNKALVILDLNGEILNKTESPSKPKANTLTNVVQGTSQSGSPTWKFQANSNEEIVGVATKDTEASIASIGLVLGNRDVLYKYLYPHLTAIGVVDKSNKTLTVNLLDDITGEILYSTIHDEIIHAEEPFNVVIGEHWIIYTYYSELPTPEQKVVVLDLFESLTPNKRLSGQNEVSVYDYRAPPAVITRSFIIPYKIKTLTLSKTKFGVTTKAVILALENGQIVYLPKFIVNSRRIDGNRQPTEDERQEFMLLPYDPVIVIEDSNFIISHKRQVIGVESIVSVPSNLESTSIVCAYGLDIFCTRVSPSGQFDKLTPSFEKFKLIGSIILLVVSVAILKPLNDSKRLKNEWVQELS